jgi:GTPase
LEIGDDSLGNLQTSPQKVILVGLVFHEISRSLAEEHLEELEKLVETAGGQTVAKLVQERHAPDPATYVGRGKAEELERLLRQSGATLVIFDDDLSPAQARNLESIIGAEVIDRSALILDIFARQARSRESRTQVELAQLNYLLPRLTRQWSHLSRQAGGIGTRGVGETQLELDRRIIRNRIAKLRSELDKIEKNRETQRKARRDVFSVALVGYTNAGKSTLFNQLTRGNAAAVDRLFATLDSKVQKSFFDAPRPTVIIDTVGFIRKLPHHLVASFRSTMEEAASASLVLHVINSTHPHLEEQRQVGEKVLADLGVDADNVIEVYNKADLSASRPHSNGRSVTLSALTGDGMEGLIRLIRDRELAGGEVRQLLIPMADSRAIARLAEVAEIYQQVVSGEAIRYVAWLPKDQAYLFDDYWQPGETGREPLAATG